MATPSGNVEAEPGDSPVAIESADWEHLEKSFSKDATAAKGLIGDLMDTAVRVSISDGRLITGQLWCFDNLRNLILLNVQETRLCNGSEQHRPMGPLVMVPGKHIKKIEACWNRIKAAAEGTRGEEANELI
mmetsp:Transcript_3922/g.9127  ORF Transcript_3922/g.9127 Transcript_3922/m.9127 type:complete len:131 (+) Transcript_3922:42-434(+)